MSLPAVLPIVPAMHIGGSTRLFFIVGDPVAQVRAPALFNPLFQRHGIDAVLVPVDIAPAEVLGFTRHALAARNVGGLWVTIPHKAALFEACARRDARAQQAQAVNAVRRAADGTLEGGLFDGEGFALGVEHAGLALRGCRALLVGTGGAGAAVAVSLAARGVQLALLDADPARAQALAARLPGARAVAQADAAGYDLVVNATPLGLGAGDPLPFDPARVDRGAMVVDILMKPTPLQAACRQRGLSVLDGHAMMLHQAPHYLDFMGLPDLARRLREDAAEFEAVSATL